MKDEAGVTVNQYPAFDSLKINMFASASRPVFWQEQNRQNRKAPPFFMFHDTADFNENTVFPSIPGLTFLLGYGTMGATSDQTGGKCCGSG